MVTRHLPDHAGLDADEGHGGAVTLIQRFGPAANLNIHLHCLVLDGNCRCGADGAPTFVEVDAPTGDELRALQQTVTSRAGRARQPLPPLPALGPVLGVARVGARHQQRSDAFGHEHFAQLRDAGAEGGGAGDHRGP
ncbi:MAG: transposase [Rubrivivax sp.]|nr:transposase [Rubrivivax sp.]